MSCWSITTVRDAFIEFHEDLGGKPAAKLAYANAKRRADVVIDAAQKKAHNKRHHLAEVMQRVASHNGWSRDAVIEAWSGAQAEVGITVSDLWEAARSHSGRTAPQGTGAFPPAVASRLRP